MACSKMILGPEFPDLWVRAIGERMTVSVLREPARSDLGADAQRSHACSAE